MVPVRGALRGARAVAGRLAGNLLGLAHGGLVAFRCLHYRLSNQAGASRAATGSAEPPIEAGAGWPSRTSRVSRGAIPLRGAIQSTATLFAALRGMPGYSASCGS